MFRVFYKAKDIVTVLAKGAKAVAIRTRDPAQFPTVFFDFNVVGDTRGVAVF